MKCSRFRACIVKVLIPLVSLFFGQVVIKLGDILKLYIRRTIDMTVPRKLRVHPEVHQREFFTMIFKMFERQGMVTYIL